MLINSPIKLLKTGLNYQSIELTDEQIDKLLAYIDLLAKWNKVYNLTSIKDKQQMIILHLLDSLGILNKLKNYSKSFNKPINIADVGTGGGLPGIPLSICLPELNFTLIDARDKKIRFLHQVVAQLKLANVKPIHTRVENYKPEQPFELIITRAFSSIKEMLTLCSSLCHHQGYFWAMKGKQPTAEISEIPEQYQVISVDPLNVYSLEAARNLVVLQTNTAEQLMRSRYTAFVLGNKKYLMDTWHSDYRPKSLTLDDSIHWVNLEILQADISMVHFRAYSLYKDQVSILEEKSFFKKVKNQWFYTTGELIPTSNYKISRNASCICGSGKKFKRCCDNKFS